MCSFTSTGVQGSLPCSVCLQSLEAFRTKERPEHRKVKVVVVVVVVVMGVGGGGKQRGLGCFYCLPTPGRSSS
ncbi:hypothetical protein PBY51_005542 [Eleginops maclovinus]|uniref:Uncharacterized protein n=1 Tax=Eleginops maclovinus TaxID=56733 RepID=A0AAN7X6J8_ELEMC|nr:hypothetical protein PBY51_005542 [Eleginops maclovinus]